MWKRLKTDREMICKRDTERKSQFTPWTAQETQDTETRKEETIDPMHGRQKSSNEYFP
mgnify:CR=1 FL=1